MNDSTSPPKGPNPDPRKITYRVGWKSGTIQMDEPDHPGAKPGNSRGTPAEPGKHGKPGHASGARPKPLRREDVAAARTVSPLESEGRPSATDRLVELLLRPAPLPSERAWAAVLAALPAAAFALLLWLAYRLNS